MVITDTRPVSVSAFVAPYDYDDPHQTGTAKRTDIAGALMLRMDNGAIVKALQGHLRGHGNFVRIHGNRGLMENCRHGDKSCLRVWREPWEKNPGEPVETVYKPDFPLHHDLATKAGHGGGDFFTTFHFAEAIRAGRQPYLDVYRGLAMTLCGIQGWRSALAGGARPWRCRTSARNRSGRSTSTMGSPWIHRSPAMCRPASWGISVRRSRRWRFRARYGANRAIGMNL